MSLGRGYAVADGGHVVARRPPAAEPAFPHHTVIAIARRRTPRALEWLLTASMLLVLAPVMGAIAVVIRWTSRGPALFRQLRLGRDEKPFPMLKFRTMYVDCDDRLHREYVQRLLTEPGATDAGPGGLYKLADDPRITPVGGWLRRTSLDELPQLLNVLRGEMALVGPRPVLPWEAEMFDPRHKRRFEVPPGITGLWQTSGRNRLTFLQALDLDVEYVERRSLWLDLQILVRTPRVILRRDGVR